MNVPAGEELGADALHEPSVIRAVEAYAAQLRAGRSRPNRAELLARFPECAAALAECLDGLEFVCAVGPELSGPGATAPSKAAEAHAAGTLGDYRIVREVGRGGMGVVYEAEQISLGRRVALKVLPFAATMDPRQLQRFQNEARAAACLHHEHIVPVHGVGCDRGVYYYAMQFIDGHTLAALIEDHRGRSSADAKTTAFTAGPGAAAPETPPVAALTTENGPSDAGYFRRAAEWGSQAAEALEHAHSLGIVHRDVKPGNLMIDGHGKLWVTDFGLSRSASDSGLTLTGDVLGTLRYMSPEQAQAKHGLVDHRTDVYSLGVTLYELLALRPAFEGSDRADLLRRVADEDPPGPRQFNRAVPADLETVVLKAMAKDLGERYATAQELADDLGRFLKDEPIRARRPSLLMRARRWARRHRGVVMIGLLGLALTLAALAVGAVRIAQERWERREETHRKLHPALADLRHLLRLARDAKNDLNLWGAVASSARQAEGILDAGDPDDRLGREARDLLATVKDEVPPATRHAGVRAEIDYLRLREAEVLELRHDPPRLNKFLREQNSAYGKLFEGVGVAVDDLSVAEAAARIRRLPVREELLAALNDWWLLRDLHLQMKPEAKHLYAITKEVDDDAWRKAMRRAADAGDLDELRRLARTADCEKQPPSNLGVLGYILSHNGPVREALALLHRAQRAYPNDFFLNHALGEIYRRQSNPRRPAEALRFYTAALSLRPRNPHSLLLVGIALEETGAADEAIAYYEKAIELSPKDPWPRSCLGYHYHYHRGDFAKAVAALWEAHRCAPNDVEILNNLANALAENKEFDAAFAAHDKVLHMAPKNSKYRCNLGVTWVAKALLNGKRDPDCLNSALDAYEKSLALDPEDSFTLYNYGNALSLLEKYDKALAAFEKAVRFKDKHRDSRRVAAVHKLHFNLGFAWLHTTPKRLDKAILEFRETIRLNPKHVEAHEELVRAYEATGALDKAIETYRLAARRWPDNHTIHLGLGNTLERRHDPKGALAAAQEAIRCKPDFAEAHCNAGQALRRLGRLPEALDAMRRGHELGSQQTEWRYPSAGWVSEYERLVNLEERLPAVLAGKMKPGSAHERMELGHVCALKKLHTEAVQFYRDAFAADPTLPARVPRPHRILAARSAVLATTAPAGAGPQLPDADRARFRQQARDWLIAELALWRERLDMSPKAFKEAQAIFGDAQQDPAFVGVRHIAALANLPDAERQAWQRLWADVDRLVKR